MHTRFEIITSYLVRNLLVCAVLYWTKCETRHLLGIGTRLGTNGDGGLLQTYTSGLRPPGGDMNGFSDLESDQFQFDKSPVPAAVWVFMAFILFFFIVLCVCSGINIQMRLRQLWGNVSANPTLPRPQTFPSMPQEHFRTPAEAYDFPPDYTEVVDQKPMAAISSDSTNPYPKVVRGNKLETPPPAYMTVAPFK